MPKSQPAFLEISELPNGDIILRRPDDTGEPLVKIQFSKESKAFLGNTRHLVAKAMIEAGLETVQELQEEAFSQEETSATENDDGTSPSGRPPVLH